MTGEHQTLAEGFAAEIVLLELLALNLINDERRQRGLQPYLPMQALAAVARSHAVDMARRSYVSHFSPEREGARARLARAGIQAFNLAENCALVRVPNAPPSLEDLENAVLDVHRGFLASPGHRRAILASNDYTHSAVGIGVADNRIGIVQMFLRERWATRQSGPLRLFLEFIRMWRTR